MAGEAIADAERLSPRIELRAGWCSGMRDGDEEEHQDEYAAVYARGHVLLFHAGLFDVMPANVAQDVIGHELAHVMQYATGYETIFGTQEVERGALEQHADELMQSSWGFDPNSIDKWAISQGLTRLIECENFDEYIRKVFGPGGRYHNPRTDA